MEDIEDQISRAISHTQRPNQYIYIYIYVRISVCLCVCVSVCLSERGCREARLELDAEILHRIR